MKNVVFITFLLLFSSVSVGAEQSIGKVILSMGETLAISKDGDSRQLKRKSEIFPNDILKTGPKGRLQIRFTDDSRLSLKPNSEFKISEYQFDNSAAEEGKAVYELIKGGMRTLTGKIGKEKKENYRVETVVATIGIRGTDYSIDLFPEKLDGTVNAGAINVSSKNSSQDIDAGESFSLEAASGAIKVFPTPLPASEEEQSEKEKSSNEEEQDEEGQDDESQNNDGTDQAASSEDSETSSETDADVETDSGTTADSSDDTSSGDDGTVNLTQQDSADSTSAALDSSLTEVADSTLGVTNVVDTNQEPLISTSSSPNPTGNGSPAGSNSLAAVAMTEIDPEKGIRAGNGAVPVEGLTSITIDNSAGTGDIVTGINYIDTSSSANIESCTPCIFSSPSSTSNVRDLGNATVNGSLVTWGRWNSGFTVIENGVTQNNLGSFHFMFTDDLTTSAQIAAEAASKSGSYLYTFSSSSKLTSPEIETGATGSLVDYATSGAPSGQLYNGTYVLVDWDTQTIDQVSIMADVADGTGTRSYHMTQQNTGNSLSSVLNGGRLTLEGTCSGGQCTQDSTNTTLSGNMSFDFVGDSADAALTSYGATGTNPSNQKVTVTGTVLLDDGGKAP